MPPPEPRPRARALGIALDGDPTGPLNAVTDVAGVRVGHRTVWLDPDVRTGVTALVLDSLAEQFRWPMAAATAALNGAGELTGSWQLREWGILETPVLLTATHAVGRAYDAVVDAMAAAVPEVAAGEEVVVPVVGECDDSWLDATARRSVTVGDARAAIDVAFDDGGDGPVTMGVVGAGAGMICMGHKGGIGSASRVVEHGTVGVLLLTNFGAVGELRLPEGVTAVPTDGQVRGDAGSCIGVVVTDVPLDRHQLARLATRVGLGLARAGSVAHHGSGEIFCAMSTTMRLDRYGSGRWSGVPVADRDLDAIFVAVVDATYEAVLDSMLVADAVTGRSGHGVPALVTSRHRG